jgi:uncharacterized protein with NAD-binding domain and iron-sulfur cluster
MKIIIIGGGIAGLSAATMLADIPELEICVYEREPQIGGQAASVYSKYCNIEYSWRVFGSSYHNLMYILNEKLNIIKNFKKIENNCFIEKDKHSDADLNDLDFKTIISKIVETTKVNDYYKYTDFLWLCKDRIMKQYDINAYDYFDENPIVQTILGPFLGMDANKVSLSGAIKNIYSIIFF